MVFTPTYSLHSIIARITGTKMIESPRGSDYLVEVDGALAAIERERPRMVILCSPNNPTGACEPLSVVQAVVDSSVGLVVVDEAYVEFAPEGSSVRAMLENHANLVMVRTLSKAWRLAGARIGYMLGAPDLVAEMARVRLPYHLSTPSQLIGTAALRREGDALMHIAAIRKERDRIVDALIERGLETYRSDANFVLFHVPEAQRVWEALLDDGVLVRNYARVSGLEGCLRVTAGLPEETDAFLAALTRAL
jgi:histidinol-phosphate aminotransferase